MSHNSNGGWEAFNFSLLASLWFTEFYHDDDGLFIEMLNFNFCHIS